MMKRLSAFLRGKIAEIKANNREEKVNLSLTAAEINFKEQRDNAKLEMDRLTESLSDCENVTETIQAIVDQMELRDEAIRGIERIEELRKYFNEEIEIKE